MTNERVSKGRKRRFLSSVSGLLRLSVFFAMVGGVCGVLSLRAARAHAEERLETIGQALMGKLGPLVMGRPEKVTVNGQTMFIALTVTPLSPGEVSARLEKYCHDHSGGLGAAIGEIPSEFRGQKIPEELRDPDTWLTMKGGDPAEFAQIACVASDRERSLEGFVAGLNAFLASSDVAELGQFRYVVARKVRGGKTHVLATWTEGRFPIDRMFPPTGDAPGSDAAEVPRPPDSVRLLSAEVSGHPYSVRMYETNQAPAAVLERYDVTMPARGFRSSAIWLETNDTRATDKPSYARAFERGGALVLVVAIEEPVTGKGTQVSLIEIGTRGKVAGGATTSARSEP